MTAEDVRRKGVAFWVCKGVLKEQKVYRQLGTSHYRSSAVLSNQDIEIVYSSVERLDLKGVGTAMDGQDGSSSLIEANEVVDVGAQEPQLIRIQQV